jgi:hypothetical protein
MSMRLTARSIFARQNGGAMKYLALLTLLLLTAGTTVPAASNPNDYPITIHVTSSQLVDQIQDLDVVIDGKQYELSAPQVRHGLLALGDYQARLTKDQHKVAYESEQIYEILFSDNKTRTFAVLGQSEATH